MTKLKRFTGKVFGGSATAVGDDPQIAQFGSALANTFVGTTDPEIIQQLPAWGQGWIGAVTPTQQYPALPEMTGAMKVLSHQICGILQQGVSTWDNGTIYYNGNFVSLNGKLYISQTDENQGNNPATDTTNWQEFSSGGGLEIGDIGIAPLGIDENKNKRRYLNGQIIIQEQFLSFTTKVKEAIALYPTLACSESDWQATALLTVGGQVGKFVVDDDAGTIRLPKIIMPIQGLTDLSKLAEIVEAGLPNIKGQLWLGDVGDTSLYAECMNTQDTGGMFYQGESIKTYDNTAGKKGYLPRYDFSRANSIYKDGSTVQQEQIQYPYFIQVATGSETEDNIINTLELNNPFVLLEPKFFEAEVYNISWLLANGTYNGSSAVHPSAYQALLVENNTEVTIGSTVTLPIGTEYTKRGLSVKLSTDSDITDYDFVVNTSDETFRLPIKVNLASGKAVVGNGMALGLTNGTNFSGLGISGMALANDVNIYGDKVATSGFTTNSGLKDLSIAGVTTDPTKSGLELSDSNLYLYFYVGETVQNANIVNIGRIEEKLSTIIPDNSELIASYSKPSRKYIELKLGATGTIYTAPANGFVSLCMNSKASAQYILLQTGRVQTNVFSTATSQALRTYIPVAKNQSFNVSYTTTGNLVYFTFIYDLGSESEA